MNKRKLFFVRGFFFFWVVLSAGITGYYLYNQTGVELTGEKEEAAEKPYPNEWGYLKKTWPYMQADPAAYNDALRQAHLLQKKTASEILSKGLSNASWEFLGPLNVGGCVVDVEFNPQNPDIVYAAFATGGVFKSTTRGQTWFPVFDSLAVLTIGDIAIDPQNPEVIYVGTGDTGGGAHNYPGGGVYKSTDAGMTWKYMGLAETVSTGRILVNPVNTNIVYLAALGTYYSPDSAKGVYKSTDGGNTWSHSLFVSDTTGAIDMIIDPVNPDRMMVSVWERMRRPNSTRMAGPTSGIYRTFDGGNSWTKLPAASGLPDPNTMDVGRIGLAVCKTNPDIVYSLFTDGYDIISLFKSTDFGESWTDVDPDNELNAGTGGFSWYFGRVKVNPLNPDMVYVLDVRLMMSSNSGNNWSFASNIHVDQQALAFDPSNPDFVICGNDGGMNISTNGGLNWGPAAHIPATQFYEIGLDANNPLAYYGGSQDNGTVRCVNSNPNNWQGLFYNDGFYVLVDFDDDQNIYAEYQFGNLYASYNGGANFNPATNGIDVNEPKNWNTPVVMDPNSSKTLYYGTDYLYRTTDWAANWYKVSPKLTDYSGQRLGTITTIAAAPSNSNVIYVGTDDSHIWASPDFGHTWKEISEGLPERWVTRVVVDPLDENIVYATFNGLKWRDPQPHVFRSTNMGLEWTDISSNLPDAPVNAFAVDPINPSILYLGNDVGAYVSYNSGVEWQALGEGLPMLTVNDMEIQPQTHELVAGTYGRSMYKINLDQLPTFADPEKQTVRGYQLEQNHPNPFNPSTRISYTVPVSSNVIIKIYDITGREIQTLVNEQKQPGNYDIVWNAANLATGVYLYRIQAGGFTETKKMLLLK